MNTVIVYPIFIALLHFFHILVESYQNNGRIQGLLPPRMAPWCGRNNRDRKVFLNHLPCPSPSCFLNMLKTEKGLSGIPYHVTIIWPSWENVSSALSNVEDKPVKTRGHRGFSGQIGLAKFLWSAHTLTVSSHISSDCLLWSSPWMKTQPWEEEVDTKFHPLPRSSLQLL